MFCTGIIPLNGPAISQIHITRRPKIRKELVTSSPAIANVAIPGPGCCQQSVRHEFFCRKLFGRQNVSCKLLKRVSSNAEMAASPSRRCRRRPPLLAANARDKIEDGAGRASRDRYRLYAPVFAGKKRH